MTDQAGTVTFAQSYDPYGVVTYTAGTSQSEFGFTGEQYGDSIRLLYLSARYYNPADGRFLTIDPSRAESNLYLYAMGNPVNYVDPSGHISQIKSQNAYRIVDDLSRNYGVYINVDWGYFKSDGTHVSSLPLSNDIRKLLECGFWQAGDWADDELNNFYTAVLAVSKIMGGNSAFARNIGGVHVSMADLTDAGGMTYYPQHRIEFSKKSRLTIWTAVHELAHAWDRNWQLSKRLVEYTGGYIDKVVSMNFIEAGLCDLKFDPITGNYKHDDSPGNRGRLPECNKSGYFYGGTPPAGAGRRFTLSEDFAESVAAYVYPDEAQSKVQTYFGHLDYGYLYYENYRNQPRWAYIHALIRTTRGIQAERNH